jgi:hypothetical protein
MSAAHNTAGSQLFHRCASAEFTPIGTRNGGLRERYLDF